MSDLQKEYDVIIVGTGLTESILAAALSRIGKTVLHLDRNQFYGGEFSSHTLASLIEWTDKFCISRSESASLVQNTTACNNDLNKYIMNCEFEWNSNISEESKNKLLKLSRKFSIDLSPNIFYSRGKFVELLISSDVSKYCEFRLVNQLLTLNSQNTLEKVPISRAEVFKTSQLTMIEKRVMMQFIQSCMKENNFEDFQSIDQIEKISFQEFIDSKKFSASITNYLNAIAMGSNSSQSALEGIRRVKKFLESVGRFGESPFLFSLYGTGELPQSFCRLAAVFGAIYHLNLTVDSFSVNKKTNLIESIMAKCNPNENLTFNSKYLVLECSYAPLEYLESNYTAKQISKCILITDKSIMPSQDAQNENISFLYLPKNDGMNSSGIYCLEASYATQCCPQGYYLVYMFCEKVNEKARDDFSNVIRKFFTEDFDEEETKTGKAKIFFSYYMSQIDTNHILKNCLNKNKIPDNLHLIGGSKVEIDFDFQVEEAEKIFREICPNEQFLPKPPEQEDIIFDDNTENNIQTVQTTENEILNTNNTENK